MGEFNGSFQVEKLNISSITGMDIDPVLEKIIPGSPKILNIDLILYVKMFEMSGMRSLKAHLAYLDKFSTDKRKIDMPIDSFAHMKNVHVQLISITEEQALRYKKGVPFDHRNRLLFFIHSSANSFVAYLAGWGSQEFYLIFLLLSAQKCKDPKFTEHVEEFQTPLKIEEWYILSQTIVDNTINSIRHVDEDVQIVSQTDSFICPKIFLEEVKKMISSFCEHSDQIKMLMERIENEIGGLEQKEYIRAQSNGHFLRFSKNT